MIVDLEEDIEIECLIWLEYGSLVYLEFDSRLKPFISFLFKTVAGMVFQDTHNKIILNECKYYVRCLQDNGK